MNKIYKKIAVPILAGLASAQQALAQSQEAGSSSTFGGFSTMMDQANQSLNGAAGAIINFISAIIGIIGVIMLAWAFYKRSKQDGNSQDSLISWGVALLFALLLLQVAKFVFFPSAS